MLTAVDPIVPTGLAGEAPVLHPTPASQNTLQRSSIKLVGSSLHVQMRSLGRGSLLSERVNTESSKEDRDLQTIFTQLTEEEAEIAARSSYNYLCDPSKKNRQYYAKQYALRFLRSKRDPGRALERMKETLRFRQNIDVDGLRNAFDDSTKNGNYAAGPLEDYLSSGSLYVQGFDRQGRSTYIFVPRKVERHDDEWTLKEHVFTLERAIACSRAPDRTVNAVVDFNGFSLRNAPPHHVGKQFMKTFRSHYAGALNQVFFVDAPAAFHCVWSVFKPFIGKETRDKIHFVKSSQARLARFYDKDQLAPWMMAGGTKKRELDINEYLHEIPFDCAFDSSTP